MSFPFAPSIQFFYSILVFITLTFHFHQDYIISLRLSNSFLAQYLSSPVRQQVWGSHSPIIIFSFILYVYAYFLSSHLLVNSLLDFPLVFSRNLIQENNILVNLLNARLPLTSLSFKRLLRKPGTPNMASPLLIPSAHLH